MTGPSLPQAQHPTGWTAPQKGPWRLPPSDKGGNAAGEGAKEINKARDPGLREQAAGCQGQLGKGVSPHLALRGTQCQTPNSGRPGEVEGEHYGWSRAFPDELSAGNDH